MALVVNTEALAHQHKEAGNKCFQESKFAEALVEYTAAIDAKHEASLNVLFSNRSATYFNLNQFENALRDADQVIALRPSWWKGHLRRSHALQGLGRYTEAKEALVHAQSLEGGSNPETTKALEALDVESSAAKALEEAAESGIFWNPTSPLTESHPYVLQQLNASLQAQPLPETIPANWQSLSEEELKEPLLKVVAMMKSANRKERNLGLEHVALLSQSRRAAAVFVETGVITWLVDHLPSSQRPSSPFTKQVVDILASLLIHDEAKAALEATQGILPLFGLLPVHKDEPIILRRTLRAITALSFGASGVVVTAFQTSFEQLLLPLAGVLAQMLASADALQQWDAMATLAQLGTYFDTFALKRNRKYEELFKPAVGLFVRAAHSAKLHVKLAGLYALAGVARTLGPIVYAQGGCHVAQRALQDSSSHTWTVRAGMQLLGTFAQSNAEYLPQLFAQGAWTDVLALLKASPAPPAALTEEEQYLSSRAARFVTGIGCSSPELAEKLVSEYAHVLDALVSGVLTTCPEPKEEYSTAETDFLVAYVSAILALSNRLERKDLLLKCADPALLRQLMRHAVNLPARAKDTAIIFLAFLFSSLVTRRAAKAAYSDTKNEELAEAILGNCLIWSSTGERALREAAVTFVRVVKAAMEEEGEPRPFSFFK